MRVIDYTAHDLSKLLGLSKVTVSILARETFKIALHQLISLGNECLSNITQDGGVKAFFIFLVSGSVKFTAELIVRNLHSL